MYYELSKKKVTFTSAVLLGLGAAVLATALVYDFYGLEVRSAFLAMKHRFDYVFDGSSPSMVAALMLAEPSAESDAASTLEARNIPVLLYHRISDEESETTISEELFKEHMFVLKRAGYESVTLEEFRQFVRGEITLPYKSFLLTFDDGARESYYPVDPILKALDFNAVSFVVTPRALAEEEHSYYLAKGEMEAMQRSGRWEIQSHGREAHNLQRIDSGGDSGHFLSNKVWLVEEGRYETSTEYIARVAYDFRVSKEDLEETFEAEVYAFAFPFGDFGHYPPARNFSLARPILGWEVSLVYDLAFFQYWEADSYAVFPRPGENGFFGRILVNTSWSGLDLLREINRIVEEAPPSKGVLSS